MFDIITVLPIKQSPMSILFTRTMMKILFQISYTSALQMGFLP